jgi:glycosyltransferase involved in cell wall biosynthesis
MRLEERIETRTRNPAPQTTPPLVSICIPTFNGARWISDCLGSALSQTYIHTEILIVDDGSTDETVEIVRSFKDDRIQLMVNDRNVGLAANWNRCVNLSRGVFIKFLFQDDILYPDCVTKMAMLLMAGQSLGLVFSARDIILEGDTEKEMTEEWLQNCCTLHTHFNALRKINRGRELFRQHLCKGFMGNWVGEPTSVMIRRECFQRLGLFNESLAQLCDVEMWLRIMFFYDIGFLDEKLSAFRFHARSASVTNIRESKNWLDYLRLLEGLLSYREIRHQHPEIVKLRRLELLRIIARLVVPLSVRRRISHYRASDG